MKTMYKKGNKKYNSSDNLIKKEFEDYPVVVRAPGAAFFFGEHAVVKGQPALYLPIPLYLYLGLGWGSRSSISIKFYYHDPRHSIYPPDKNKRIIHLKRLDNDDKETVEEALINALKSVGKNSNNLKVKLISEIPIKCGLNSSGAFAATFSTAFYLLENEITQNDIQRWRTSIQNNDIQSLKDNGNFMKVFKLAYAIDKEIQGNTSGIGPLASLIGSSSGRPFMYFRYVPVKNYSYFKSVDREGIKNIDTIFDKFYARYVGKSIIDSVPTKTESRSFLILAYSGVQSETSDAFTNYESRLNSFNATITQLSNELRNNEVQLEIIDNNQFHLVSPLRTYLALEDIEATAGYLDSRFMGILGGYALAGIGEFKKNMTSPELFDLMNQYHDLLKILDLSSQELDELKRRIEVKLLESKHSKKHKSSKAWGIGIKLTGSGVGGDLIVWGRGNLSYYEDLKNAICEKRKNAIHFDSIAHLKLFPNSPWAEGITIIKSKPNIEEKSVKENRRNEEVVQNEENEEHKNNTGKVGKFADPIEKLKKIGEKRKK